MALDMFTTQAHALISGMTQLVLNAHTAIGAGLLLVLGVQVLVVLVGMYARSIRTRKQLLTLLLILFAAIVICCIAVWLLVAQTG